MYKSHDIYEIAPDVYWTGEYHEENVLQYHSYLIKDHNEAVLVDPGPRQDFEITLNKILNITTLESIRYIIVSHPEIEVCAMISRFEDMGFKGKVVCHWKTSMMIKDLTLNSPFLFVDQIGHSLYFGNDRILKFIHAPYLQYPGSIITYDKKSRVLFSGDLFGAPSYTWKLFADENYLEGMKMFHESFISSNDVLKPVINTLLNMEIEMIAPQHGSIIKKSAGKFIETLKGLECGNYIEPYKRNITEHGGYVIICNYMLRRACSIFGQDEVRELFNNSEIRINDKLEIQDFNCTGEELWDYIFVLIHSLKGYSWIYPLESLVIKMVKKYNIPLPRVLESSCLQEGDTSHELDGENIKLKDLNDKIRENIAESEAKLTKCPDTGFYTDHFFREFLPGEVRRSLEQKNNSALFLIDIDNINDINVNYGRNAGNEVVLGVADILHEFQAPNQIIARIGGSEFAYLAPNISSDDAFKLAEDIRLKVLDSDIFVEKITVSAGIVYFQEFFEQDILLAELVQSILNTVRVRQRIAKKMGKNRCCDQSDKSNQLLSTGGVLVVDTDKLSNGIIRSSLEKIGLTVHIAEDGERAFELVTEKLPEIIISEIHLPKTDGFTLCGQVKNSSLYKNIPFVFISFLKDERSVERAYSYGASAYIKKPFLVSEILGLVKNTVNK